MAVRLRKLDDQVMVITGASSGIGLATARMAAERGARVVLFSRDATDLDHALEGIRKAGGEAMSVAGDVADPDDVHRLAETAVQEFGGIDTWVNNAGVSVYGAIEQVPIADARRLFETNYWGVVNGSLAALPVLKERGGALINMGSTTSDLAIPLQGHYSASKHAVKGFTDALRLEVEKEGAPVSVTLIKPGAIDTPYPEHARNYMNAEPKHPPPVYTPDVVARAILFCAEHPRRDMFAGGGGKFQSVLANVPRIADRYLEATAFDRQKRIGEPTRLERQDALFEPHPDDAAERGTQPGRVHRHSAYTAATTHPVATLLGAAALGVGLAIAARARES